MAKIWKLFPMLVVLVLLVGLAPIIFPSSQISADVSGITVTPRDSQVVGQSTGYDISITVGAAGGLAPGDTVTVEFPPGTTVPVSMASGYVFIKTVPAQSVSVSSRQVTVTLAAGCLVAHNETFTLTFATGAGLKNPTTPGTDKAVTVWTNRETNHVTSSSYTIGAVEVKRDEATVGTYVTIQAAIDDAGTQDGDTVLIYSATFTENVIVNKELTLEGTGATVPMIDGAAGGTTVTIAASNVTLTGLTIQNGPTGVAVTSGTGNKINSCNIITNTTYGINNTSGTAIDASNNWWDSANGPEHSGNTFNVGFQGDIVSDSVGYVRWLNAAYPSGTSFAPVTKNSATTYYSSIQAAITAAATGDIITCQTGTFTEDLNVITDNLTLKSASGRDSTIIQLKTGADNAGIGIQGTASNFKLGGAVNQGFNIKGGTGADMRNIQLVNAPSGVTISHNTIDTTGSAAQGISVGAAGATGLTVSNNNFIAATISGAGEISIWGPDVVNVNVSNNQFTGPGSTTITSAVNLAGATSATTSTISGNTISGYGSGIFIYSGVAPDSGTTVVDNVTISDNTISDCGKGIRLGHSSNTLEMTRVTAENNTLSTNTIGLYVANAANIKADQFTIRHNNFSGNNVTYGLQNANATYGVTAKYNFWGHAYGPTHTDATLGDITYGDTVTGTVTFQPWLIAAYTTAPTGGDISIFNASPLPDGETAVYYSENLTSNGGAGTKTWAFYGPGSLGETPPGLSIRPTGEIYGTPTKTSAGFIFGIQVKDALQGAYKAFELPVYIGQLPVITTTSLRNGRVGTAYLDNLTATGGTGTYAWSIYSGSWPHDLSLNAGTGVITGTPTVAGTANFRAKVVSGGVAYKDLSITITPTPGTDEIGIWRGSTRYFYLDTNGDGKYTNPATESFGTFLSSYVNGDMPVAGDWDNDGTDEIGVWRGSTRYFYLDTNGDGKYTNSATERFGPFLSATQANDRPVAGDWDNDGDDEIGVWRGSTRYFYLDTNGDGKYTNPATERFGPFLGATQANDRPVAGDWDGL